MEKYNDKGANNNWENNITEKEEQEHTHSSLDDLSEDSLLRLEV